MIYWHVETGRLCVYSQLRSCSSSEVAAMMEGLLHHGTDVPVEANYVDTHGTSVIGFAFTRLLGYQLLPRLKNIGASRLYLPDPTLADGLPQLTNALTRPIRWELTPSSTTTWSATRPRCGYAPRRPIESCAGFTRPGPQHPHLRRPRRARPRGQVAVRRPLSAVGNAAPADQRRPAGDRKLELGQYSLVFYGKDSELTGADRDSQEISVLALHLLQSALVYVNTLLLQRILSDRPVRLTDEDRRAITPLFWTPTSGPTASFACTWTAISTSTRGRSRMSGMLRAVWCPQRPNRPPTPALPAHRDGHRPNARPVS